MKLGAQLYSLRTECDTPEKLRNTFKVVKDIGYDIVQASAICDIEPERLYSYVEEFSLPVMCTHRSFKEITENTDWCINFHKTVKCPVIGLGAMPTEYRDSLEGIKAFKAALAEPVKKIKAAGLSFAYHNHGFDFDTVGGIKIYDFFIEEMPDIDFILDVYWAVYASEDPKKYIELFAKQKRLTDIHYKDMKTAPQGPICPCGDGVIDFSELTALCTSLGIKHAYVEQDNAPELGDVFAQMKSSHDHLRPIIEKYKRS